MQPTHTMAQYNSNRNKNKSYSTLVPFTYQPTTSQSHNERDYALLIWKNFSKAKRRTATNHISYCHKHSSNTWNAKWISISDFFFSPLCQVTEYHDLK